MRRKTASSPKAELDKHHKEAEAMLDEIYSDNPAPCRSCSLKHIGHEEGDEIDMLLHHHKPLDTGKLGYKITHNLYIVFWIILLAGLVLGIVDLTGIDVNDMGGIKNLGYILGFAGTAVTIFFMIASKRLITAQSHEDVEHKLYSLRETFIHNAKETAFVGTWVFGAYLIYEIGAHLAGGDAAIEQLLTSTGIIAVLIGVAVGIIPGCGPQVIFVSLYLKGMFPFTALLANAISQDGDALFPLIAMDRKAAFWTTVVNTVVALVIGVGLFYMGRWLGIEFPNFALASASSS
ncbi:MAG: arsenic efflux protein [Lentisphaerae bacterium]|nr:arsenic efflux protein [Lentisphaerota bacterium]